MNRKRWSKDIEKMQKRWSKDIEKMQKRWSKDIEKMQKRYRERAKTLSVYGYYPNVESRQMPFLLLW